MPTPDAAAFQDIQSLGVLEDPTRRALYEFVAAAAAPVGRDAAAAATDVARSLAAYHLDRLARAGLVEVSFARPHGRGGPGAGRPAKLYRRAERAFVLSAPPRDYPLLAEVLLHAAEDRPALRPAIAQAGRDVGEEIGRAAGGAPLGDVLRARGYEPYEDADGTIRFRNCPFHAAADAHRAVVCELNLALVEGILRAAAPGAAAALEPGRAGCCVAVRTGRGMTAV